MLYIIFSIDVVLIILNFSFWIEWDVFQIMC